MPKKSVAVGDKYSLLTVVDDKIINHRVLCQCECGKLTKAVLWELRSYSKKSCGCLRARRKRVTQEGAVYGYWIVVGEIRPDHYVPCKCRCGTERPVHIGELIGRRSQSCGCLAGERARARNKTHGGVVGGKAIPEYLSWQSMRQRCFNPKATSYKNYGARGILVCQEWLGPMGFEKFLQDMGPRPSLEYSLDRINTDGPYCPENCRWSSRREQSQNRRNSLKITVNAITKPAIVFCEEYGIKYCTWHRRITRYGLDPITALLAPLGTKFK